MVREVIRCVISLRAVHTALPIHILASGERYPQVEALLSKQYALTFLTSDAQRVVTPSWASKWARGSFAKLRALTLTQFDTIVLLDADNIALRNIDHLARAPPPAFVFGWKCYPRRELRTAVAVLRPNEDAWARARLLLANASAGVYDDLGEGSVWRRLYATVHELPAGFAAMRTADLSSEDWGEVSIVHDAHLIHDVQRAGWHAARMGPKVEALDREATRAFNTHFGSFFAASPRAGANKRGQRQRGGKTKGRVRRKLTGRRQQSGP